MSEKIILIFKNVHPFSWIILLLITFSIYSCGNTKPARLLVLGERPILHTFTSFYPTIEIIYKSDEKIVIVATWDVIPKSENHELKWVMSNNSGEKVYQSPRENITFRPHIISFIIIWLHGPIKKQLVDDTYRVELYIDDQLSASQNINYVSTSILNKNVRRAVILPFEDISYETNLPQYKVHYMLNTIADAIYGEVKRIIPDAIPQYIVDQKIGKLLKPNCVENIECVDLIKNTFGESIFIFGNIKLVKFSEQLGEIKVYVYNAKSGALKEFYATAHLTKSYGDLVHNLLKGVMQKEGLLDYLKTISLTG